MILTKPRLIAAQRFDLEDWKVLLNSAEVDAKFWTKGFWAPTAYILSGFTVSGVGSTSPATVTLTNSTLINPDNSGDFSWYSAEPGASPILVPLNAGTRNYLELKLSKVDGTPLSKAFWDKAARGGLGQEFQQITNTTTDLTVSVEVRTGSFSGSSDLIPLAIVDTDGSNNIVAIRDKRNLMWRLGTPANPEADYAWASRVEPASTLALSSVSGTFQAGETVIFSSGATAEVLTGGTTSISVTTFSNDDWEIGDTVTGADSGASATLDALTDAFTGADKSITNLREMVQALTTEIKKIKGTKFWFETANSDLSEVSFFLNSTLTAESSTAKWSWDGSDLILTDAEGTPSESDDIAKISILGKTQVLNLKRQDGQDSTSEFSLSDGDVLFVKVPTSGNRDYSGIGTADDEYQITTVAEFVNSRENYWLAFREGSSIYVRGSGKLDAGQEVEISVSANKAITNPMTSIGDLIVGGIGGAPIRRAIGAADTVFQVNAGGTDSEWAKIQLQNMDSTQMIRVAWSNPGDWNFGTVFSGIPQFEWATNGANWDGNLVKSLSINPRQSQSSDVKFSPCGEYIAVAGMSATEGVVVVRRQGNNLVALPILPTPLATTGGIVEWSPNGQFLAAAGVNTVRCWSRIGETFSVSTLGSLPTYTGSYAPKVAWSPNNKYLAIGGFSATEGCTLYSVSGTTFTKIALPVPLTSVSQQCVFLGFSSDSRWLYYANNGATTVVQALDLSELSAWVNTALVRPALVNEYGDRHNSTNEFIYGDVSTDFLVWADPSLGTTGNFTWVGTAPNFPGSALLRVRLTSDSKYAFIFQNTGDRFYLISLDWSAKTAQVISNLTTTVTPTDGSGIDVSPDGQYVVQASEYSVIAPFNLRLFQTLSSMPEQGIALIQGRIPKGF